MARHPHAREAADPASRDSNLASIWRRLNRVGLCIGVWLGPAASIGYLFGLHATRRPAFGVMAALSAAIGASSVALVRRHSDDAGLLLVLGGVSSVVAATLVPPVVRGAMVGAIVVLATLATLILPDRSRRTSVASLVLLETGVIFWPVLGLSTSGEALATAAVALPSLLFGLLGAGLTRAALERSEHTRIEIFRRVPVGLFRSSPDGRIIDANPAVAEMLGMASASLVGARVADLHARPEDWTELVSSLNASGEPKRFAQRMVRADHSVIWIRGVADAVRDAAGRVVYHEGVIEDNTQRREVEEAARLNAERFKNVFERAPIALWEEDFSGAARRLEHLMGRGVTDLRAHLQTNPGELRVLLSLIEYLDVNPAGIHLIGATDREDAMAKVVPDIPAPEVAAAFVEQFCAIWDGRDHLDVEVTGRTVEGGTIDLSLSWAAARHDDDTLDASRVIVALTDIGVVRRAERTLEALVASKDELVASVSHELRTPITAILGMAFELRDNADAFTREETSGLVDLIADQSRELSNIVDDLLVAARADLDTLAVRPEVVPIATEIAQIVASTAPGLSLEVTIPQGVAAWVDPLRFRQIVRNLLSNALRYGGDRVRVIGGFEAGGVYLRVLDDGAGIPLEDRESVFLPYTRSRSDTALPGSIGLGLPVSRRLARLMGGDLTYRYENGSVFELTLLGTHRHAAAV